MTGRQEDKIGEM